ncbi:MAG: hypothetical protein HKL90_09995 [Elusimicrobia bacterium]|nr:hypothetical protein [Elusimicrobiota bacterium]
MSLPRRIRTRLAGLSVALGLAAPAAAQLLASYPVVITNSQGTATPATSQQLVQFNPSLYSTYEAADLGNILFCADSACATPLNAWLESCAPGACGPTASTATVWVQLTSAIAANGSATIYIGFQATGTEFNGTTWGEAPQLSGTWGQYDNGAQVFTQYGGGNGLGTGWSALTTVNGTWTTTGGPLQQTSSAVGTLLGGPAALVESTSYAANASYVLETAFSYTTQTTPRAGLVAVGTPSGGDVYGYRFLGQQSNNGAGFLSFLNDLRAWVVNNTYTGSVATAYTMQVLDNAGTWSGNLYAGYGVTSTPLIGLAPTAYTAANNAGATTGYVGLSAAWYNGTHTIPNPATFQWFRMRSLPPAGVMPTASVIPLQGCNGIILTNSNATTATPVPYQQALTFYPTSYATIERADLGNIRYCADSTCQTPLYAWLGGCGGSGAGPCSPTAASATAWVKLQSAIPAGGTQTIYQCFLLTNVGFDGNYWGESVDIAAGQDNGANVFTYYNNGQTTTGLTAVNGTVGTAALANPYGAATNVISLTSLGTQPPYETVAWNNAAVVGDNFVLEGWVDRNSNSTVSAMLAARGANAATTTNYLLGVNWAKGGEATIALDAAGTLASAGTAAATWQWAYGVVTGSALTEAVYSFQPELGGVQASSTSVADTTLTSANQFIGIADTARPAKTAYFYQWRARVYFPSSTGGVADSTAPVAVTDLAAADIATSSAALSWTAPSDLNVPSVYPSISQYAIQYASYTAGVVWSTANAQVMIATSGVTAGTAQGAFITGLNANTTYYFYLWSQDPGLLWSPLSNGATTVTLASPINAATGAPISITASSVTVSWTALPATPQSSACEGYELDVSTTNFGSGTVYTSTTSNGVAFALAVAGLNTGTTMYFRVATLNWSGAPDYVYLSSANIQISPSIATLIMGLDANVQFSTVSVSSFVVTNAGNLPLTLVVSGSTITAGSPWVLSVSSAVEAPVLQGEFNATQPVSTSFATAITSAPVVSGALGGNYAGGQSGKALAPGASATMWFKFWAPTSTVAVNIPEVLQVVYRAVYP